MTKALIYCRNSHGSGRSVAEQELEGRETCEREGWEVAAVVTDLVGASRHSKGTRTGWARTCEIVRSGAVDVLVTWEASRAQRDLDAYADLRRLCVGASVLWNYSGRTYDLAEHDARFRTGLDALLAEREADEIAERVQRAIRANAAAGRPHGRRLFGYQRTYDPATGALIGQQPHPDEAPVVRRVFADYLGGLGVRTIARQLNAEDIRTGTGAQWSDTTVRAVLVNPAYIAKRVHQGEVIGDAVWPPLVDEATFKNAGARLISKRTSATRQTRTANLLSGVARCGVCGGKMQRGHDRKQRKTYLCKEKFCVARDLVKLDAFVSAIVVERLSRPDVADALHSRPDGEQAELDLAAARVRLLRGQLDDAVHEFTEGHLTAATLAKIETKLNAQISEADAGLRRAALPLDLDVPTSNVATWWEDLTPEVRREVVATLFAAVVVLPAKRGSRTFDPETIRIEWRR